MTKCWGRGGATSTGGGDTSANELLTPRPRTTRAQGQEEILLLWVVRDGVGANRVGSEGGVAGLVEAV